MAAPLRNKMLLINVSAKGCSIAPRSFRGRVLLVTTFRHFSQLPRCPRWHRTLKKSDCLRISCGLSAVRHASTDVKPDIPAPPEVPSGFVPDTPVLPEDIIPNLPDLNALGEPTLRSLGLGSNWPTGLFQKGVEFIHVHADVPWWTAIVASVVVIRCIIFPLMIKQQRSLGRFEKNRPQLTKLQNAYDEARLSQDPLEIMKKTQELHLFMRDKKMNMMYLAMPMFIQMPIFMSAFLGLRRMADLPVESLTTGGMGWFADLTVTDPVFILPIMGTLALLLNFETGAETASARSMTHAQKWFLRGTTGLFFVVMCFTPTATCLYFTTNNTLTMIQAMILRRPRVREYFSLPPRLKATGQKDEQKGFVEGFKDMFAKRRQQKEIVNRRYTDEERFKKAGTGPVPKTYAYNPKAIKAAV